MCWRQACDTQKPEPLQRRHSLMAHSLLPLAEKQQRVLRNLRRLQGLGLVRANDCYQGLVDELAKVITQARTACGGCKATVLAFQRQTSLQWVIPSHPLLPRGGPRVFCLFV